MIQSLPWVDPQVEFKNYDINNFYFYVAIGQLRLTILTRDFSLVPDRPSS